MHPVLFNSERGTTRTWPMFLAGARGNFHQKPRKHNLLLTFTIEEKSEQEEKDVLRGTR